MRTGVVSSLDEFLNAFNRHFEQFGGLLGPRIIECNRFVFFYLNMCTQFHGAAECIESMIHAHELIN